MKIEQKLQLSEQPITFIREGLFFKIYNQSLYALTQQLHLPLKTFIKPIKKLNCTVISGGVPLAFIEKQFPNATPTVYGYHVAMQVDLSDYQSWYQTLLTPTLTPEHMTFLSAWTADKNSPASDREFILALRKHFKLN